MDKPLYKKVLLKLSGEVLMGKKSFGIDFDILNSISSEIKNAYDDDIKLSIVIGGGNIFRGVNNKEFSMERTDADYVGMISTIINGITLKNSLKKLKLPVVLYSALKIENVCNSYNIEEAKKLFEENNILIFVAGTGNPFFTTDTTAVIRGLEMDCDIILKATKVDGIYDKDPHRYNDAIKFDKLSYRDVLEKKLLVMDMTAISLADENNLPILVFSIKKKNQLNNVLHGNGSFTIVS
ncbi:MAG: UMP kinase [Alphaproteobacteria bacterium]|jgi:uridylate kinase|tara:strand:+ start:25824 stop:26537 length:714 start_codon:yes stop_codon:yes gene_type:complete